MQQSVYRIIDANFNRAREAARVIEEFCRFYLNSDLLTDRAKRLRHKLCSAISQLDQSKLIASRDTVGDVGVGAKVEGQLKRENLRDCLLAGCKRLPEALRAIAEVSCTIDPSVAEAVESIRYEAYTLEKDIITFSDTVEKYKRVLLYVIITSELPAEIISLTQYCVTGQADCIQLRAKGVDDDKLFALAEQFAGICRDGGVLSIINDRADIAIAAGADGVHLGQHELGIEQVRKLQLSPLIIGKTTHSAEQLKAACEQCATYVSLGPVFKTDTKPNIVPTGIKYVTEGIEMLSNTGIQHAAIGGITENNVEQVLQAGARTIAVCAAVAQSKDPVLACQRLKKKIIAFEAQ